MRGRGLAGRVRGRRGPGTTQSDHALPIAPHRLGPRETPVERPNEGWVADITSVPTEEGWLSLAGVLGLGSRRLVGGAMGANLDTSLPRHALKMALGQRQPKEGLLHHSDRGSQYASEAYREHLAAWKLTPSLSRRANRDDNAAMERLPSALSQTRLWSTLEEELIPRRSFVSRAEAASAIFDDIETFYNRERLRSAPGYLSPVEFEKQSNLN